MNNIKLIRDDCLKQMKNIEDNAIDLILCDLPYGTLARGYRDQKAKWDKNINLELLFKEYKRIIKYDGIICLFGVQPFTSDLIQYGKDIYRYSWIWKKNSATGFLNANYKPLSITEDIIIFSKASVGSASKNPIRYYPQGIIPVNKKKKNNPNSKFRENVGSPSKNNILNSDKEYVQKYTNYPNTMLEFSRDKEHFHPTQKPVELLKYLIKTYTKENELVLDNTMGSASTGVACLETNRNFIGIEKDDKYFDIAVNRINTYVKENNLNNVNVEIIK